MTARKAVPKTCLAGHPRCDCKLLCCSIPTERVDEIKASARSGTNWAEVASTGPACECGLRTSTVCHRHPEK